MIFGTPGSRGYHEMTDYVTAMDPDIYRSPVSSEGGPAPRSGYQGSLPGSDSDTTLGIQDIGMSVPMGISAQNVAGVYSKIRMGAGKLEIQFPGYRSGQRQQQTPGMYGEDQRQAFREMQMANEVRANTHSSFGIMGMMGRDERGNFSIMNSYGDVLELKRAIDFQADIGGGGSVVVHSGEFDRPMSDMHLDDETHQLNLGRDPDGRLRVKQHVTQELDAQFIILDDRTSQKMETVQKDRLVAYPVWNQADHDYEGEDQDGNKVFIKKGDYIDYHEKKIIDPYHPSRGRVPKFERETGRFQVEMKHFDYFKEEAERYNQWFKEKHGREPDYYEKKYPEEWYIGATLESNEGHARGWALEFGFRTDRIINQIKHLDKAVDFYKKLDKSIPEDEKWKIMKKQTFGLPEDLVPPVNTSPLKVLKDLRNEVKGTLEYARLSSAAQEQSARDTYETRQHLITPIKRLEKYGVRNYAEAGLHAMQKTRDPNNPVTVTIENLFPEKFGGNLEELKWLVKKSRERMADFLTKPKIDIGVSRKPIEMDEDKLNKGLLQENPYYKGVSREEAEKIAERHIKVTLDTGHLNMWRKYWQDDPKLTKEQNEDAYKKWILTQVESLAKEGMIGNVHLADNFGYQDDHLAPGQGNAPIKEVVNILKKHGYDKSYTVEPGADATSDLSDFHGLMKTWRHFGAPIYGVGLGGGGGMAQSWTDVQHSYFGQNRPPYYIFGGYAPSNDWTMWSQVPLE